jgi:hypothetical protein
MTGADAVPDPAPEPLSIEVRRGRPSAEELAALIAVVSEAYAAEAADALAPEPRSRDAWTVTQRGLREPLRRELGWARSGW